MLLPAVSINFFGHEVRGTLNCDKPNSWAADMKLRIQLMTGFPLLTILATILGQISPIEAAEQEQAWGSKLLLSCMSH